MQSIPIPFPSDWLTEPPRVVVTGNGPYAAALAFVFGAQRVKTEALCSCPPTNSVMSLPRVLSNVEYVIHVIGSTQSASDALNLYEMMWRWLEKLSSQGADHEVCFMFVVPRESESRYERAIATGLAVDSINPSMHGHAVAKTGAPLEEIIRLLRKTLPCDLVRLQARRAAEGKRKSLAQLSRAILVDDPATIVAAAHEVAVVFRGKEHDLDLFCRPPGHANGNRLRFILKSLVTTAITPDCRLELAKEIPLLLS